MDNKVNSCFRITVLIFGFGLISTTLLKSQCGTLNNPQTDQSTYCPDEQMLFSIDGFNLEDETEVEWYWSLTSGFDPYSGGGTFIGDDEGAYNNCDEDPDVGSIQVDGCGSGPNGETNSEYVIIESGGGFYINDFFLTLDDNNDGPPINLLSPGTSGCPWQVSPYTQYVTGCSSIIGLGPGDFVPANSILIVQTSSDYNYTLNANSASLCGANGCIYVVTSNCNRTGFGAFSNSGNSSLRTTDFDFGCTSVSITYDRADIGGSGTFIDGDENIGSVPCNGTPSPGDVTNYQIPTTFDDVLMTVPSSWCGSTIYFRAIVDVNDVGDCCTEISSDEIAITFSCPDANPAGPLNVCEENSVYTYDLTQLDGTVSGGIGTVTWYTDVGITNMIADPTQHITSNTSVWAVVTSGGCVSDAVEITLNQLPAPTANQFDITNTCTSLDPYDLDTDANPNINATETITWYETDPSLGGAVQIGPPTNAVNLNPYNGGSIWAQVEDANGCTHVIEVSIDVDEIPEGCLSGDLEICESGCADFDFSFTGGSGTYDTEVEFNFLGLPFGPFSFPSATNATTFTLCFNPDNTLPTFSGGAITLPTCDPFGIICLGEGDIISLELITLVDADTGCAGTVGPNCTQSIEFHPDPDITLTQVDATCFGEQNGSIDLTISNGNSPYDFDWNNGLPDTEDQSNLGQNTYEVTVTDVLGCSATDEIVINELDEIMLQILEMNETCEDDNDGTISVTPSDGIPPYSYDWNDNTYDGMNMLTNLSDGSYTVTVEDMAGCTSEETITVLPGAATVIPMFSIDLTYCQNDSSDPLLSISDNNVTGTWDATSIDTDDEGVTLYNFTPDAGQCSNPIDIVVTVVFEPILSIFDIQCDGSDYTFEVEVEGSPNTTYELTGTSVIGSNSTTIVTNSSGFGSESYILPNTLTSVTLQAILSTPPFCNSSVVTINSPVCDCPTVNNASLDQVICDGQTVDLSDASTGFSITADPNGFAANLVWTTNNLDPDNGGLSYAPTSETNETCSLTSFELYAWLECEIGGLVDSYVPSGSITISVNPAPPMIVTNVIDIDVCSGQLGVIEYYLAAADGSQCNPSIFIDASENNTCDILNEPITLSYTSAEVQNILGVNDMSCQYTNLLLSETINVNPAGYNVIVLGSGECTDLTVELSSFDGTVCDEISVPCQDNTTLLTYDFSTSLGFTPITGCDYDNLSGVLSCGNCSCTDPALVSVDAMLTVCPVAGTVIELNQLNGSISGPVADGTWSGGGGVFDSSIFSTATTYTLSQSDIDAGSSIIILTSDSPSNPECDPVSQSVLITFSTETEDIIVMEMPCMDSGFTYESPSGMVYNSDSPSGTEDLLDQNGCPYQVIVNLDFQPLPELLIIDIECGTNDDYSVTFNLTGNLQNFSHGILIGTNIIDGIPNDTPLSLTLTNNGLCEETIVIPNPNCGCPSIDPPVSLGDVNVCEGDPIPPLEVSDSNNNTINWYSDPIGTNYLATGSTYTPIASGTYYAQTEDLAGCTSTTLTGVTMATLSPPTLSADATCDPDGTTYQVTLSLNATSPSDFTASTGTVTDLGSDDYLIEDIDINTNLTILYSLVEIDCGDVLIVNPPQCGCGEINPPISIGDEIICSNESNPELSVSVDLGNTALWYSDQLLTDLVNSGTTYTPTQSGTYYVISEEVSTGCQSTQVTEVSLTIITLPNIVGFNQVCSDDLSEYTVTFDLSDNQGFTVSTNVGQLTALPDLSYEISAIPSSNPVEITVSSDLANCTSPISFPAPDCNCPTLQPPVNVAFVQYCAGDAIPALSAVTSNNYETYWYGDVALTQLLSTENTYTPSSPGIFYITTYDPASDCQSISSELTLIEDPLPDLNSFTAYCDEDDTNSYIVEITQASDNMAVFDAGIPTTADGTFIVINAIPLGQDLVVDLMSSSTTCVNTITIPAPDCACIDPPQVMLTLPESICEGDDIILSATGTGFSDSSWETTGDGVFANQFDLNTIYTPGNNDISAGSVTFEFIAEDPDDSGPCVEVTIVETVSIVALTSLPTTQTQITYCKGETPELLSPQGTGYSWYDNNLNLLNQAPIVDTDLVGSTTYFVSHNINGCESELVEVTITTTQFNVDYELLSFCTETLYTAILLNAVQSGGSIYTIETNGYVYEVNNFDVPLPIPYPLNTPISMLISDDNGCSVLIESTEILTSLSEGTAAISEIQIGENTFELNFETDLLDSEITNFEWTSSSELSCTYCENPEITLTQDETILLTITTTDGCKVTSEINLIYQLVELEVFVPNIFKPGTRDNNSTFYPQSKANLGTLDKLSIYDRWGTLVYSTTEQALNDPSIGWDGTYNGSVVEQGVYIYAMEITTLDGEKKVIAGDITVVR